MIEVMLCVAVLVYIAFLIGRVSVRRAAAGKYQPRIDALGEQLVAAQQEHEISQRQLETAIAQFEQSTESFDALRKDFASEREALQRGQDLAATRIGEDAVAIRDLQTRIVAHERAGDVYRADVRRLTAELEEERRRREYAETRHDDFLLRMARVSTPRSAQSIADEDIPDPPSVAIADRASLEVERMTRSARTDESRVRVNVADDEMEPAYRAHDPEAE